MDAIERAIASAKALLRSNGYVVIPEERRVIVQANFIMPQFELQRSRLSAERVADMALSANLPRIVREVLDKGLCVSVRHDIEDCITGRELVLTTAIGLIKPKAKPKAEDEV